MEQSPVRTWLFLAHPLAYAVTILFIVAAFSWTFVAEPGRPIGGDDPAYYTWRAEALLEHPPAGVLDMTGPLEMYSGGYRVATPVLAAVARRLTGMSVLTPTVLLGVGMRTIIPLLLAGYAFRSLRDPLAWHAVALGSASMLLFPPFGGYMDNMLALLMVAASLFFLEPARSSWPARAAITLLLTVAGLTHPTTLAAFALVVLGAVLLEPLFAPGSARSAVRHEAGSLVAVAAALVMTFAAWKGGLWGVARPLVDAALPPPAPASFYTARLTDWVLSMRPVVNLPLAVIGAAGLLSLKGSAVSSELSRVTFAWLLPLIGILGFVTGAAYPYYRFFNASLGWVLLIALGIFFLLRHVMTFASDRRWLRPFAVLVLGGALFSNLFAGYAATSWNDANQAWIAPHERVEMRTVRDALTTVEARRPIVFVLPPAIESDLFAYGFAKRAGNVTRHAVPGDRLDRVAFFFGSLEDAVAGRPSPGNSLYQRELSEASLADVQKIVRGAGSEPLYVVPSAFAGGSMPSEVPGEAEVWLVSGPNIASNAGPIVMPAALERSGPGGWLRPLVVLFVLSFLLLPGLLATGVIGRGRRGSGGDDPVSVPVLFGLIPAFSLALVAVSGIVVLAIARAPLSASLAWWAVALATGAGAALGAGGPLLGSRSPVP